MNWEGFDFFYEYKGLKGFDRSFRNGLSANGTVSNIPFELIRIYTLLTKEVMVRTDLKRLFPVTIILLEAKETL